MERFANEIATLLSSRDDVSTEQLTQQTAELAKSLAEAMTVLRGALGDVDPEQVLAMIRDMAEPGLATTKPGVYMQRSLRDARRRDLGRNSKRSDLVDLRHVQYVPYVDIFTTDKENVAVLSPVLAKWQWRRQAKVLRNRNLDRVIEEVNALA